MTPSATRRAGLRWRKACRVPGAAVDPLGPIDRWRDQVRRDIRAEVGDNPAAWLPRLLEQA